MRTGGFFRNISQSITVWKNETGYQYHHHMVLYLLSTVISFSNLLFQCYILKFMDWKLKIKNFIASHFTIFRLNEISRAKLNIPAIIILNLIAITFLFAFKAKMHITNGK